MSKTLTTMLLAVLLVPPAVAQARADESAPQVLAASCVACHGTAGKSAGAIPSIVGMKAEEMTKHLAAFRDGSQASTVMNRIAKGYTDAEIAALAKEIATWTN